MKLSNRALYWITTVVGLAPILSNYFHGVGLVDESSQKLIIDLAVAVLGYLQFSQPKKEV